MHKNIISYVASKVTEKEPEIHEIMLLTAYYPSTYSCSRFLIYDFFYELTKFLQKSTCSSGIYSMVQKQILLSWLLRLIVICRLED